MCRLAWAVGLGFVSGGCAAQSIATPEAESRLASVRFHTSALGTTKRYFRYLPPSYHSMPARRYPVVYLLHGYGADEAEWITKGAITRIVDSLVAGGMPELILVMPDGDNSFWTDWDRSADMALCAADTARQEPASSFCVPHSRYGTYLARDLVAEVDRNYRTIPDRGGRAVMGVSMGGNGALTLGFTWHDRFSAVVALSPPASPLRPGHELGDTAAPEVSDREEWERIRGRPLNQAWRLRWGTDTSQWWRQDPARSAQRLRAAGQRAPALRLDVGAGDLYLLANRALHRALDSAGVAHQYFEPPGVHDWPHWHRRAPPALRWLAGQLSP